MEQQPESAPTEMEQKLMQEADADTSSVAENRSASGGLIYMSPEQLQEQRAVCLQFLRNLGYNFLTGGDVVNTSLPVRLFESRSFLERITDFWAYIDLLKVACKAENPEERMKYVVAFALGGLHREIMGPKKPFNPLLGETFQASFQDGSDLVPIFCEQTSHHPPVSSFELLGPSDAPFKLFGSIRINASVRGNVVNVYHYGKHVVEFPDGSSVSYDLPTFNLHGIFYGERVATVSGKMQFRDVANQVGCVVTFNPDAKGFLRSLLSWRSSPKKPADYFIASVVKLSCDALERDDLSQEPVICSGDGSWLESVTFDGKVYWDIKQATAKKAVAVADEEALPTDCRFREDVQTVGREDWEGAQKAKHNLEEKQREEARFRKAGYAKRKPA
mmetsp:Transcript_15437/g.26518  ORF Transcript_15437/g.26518 Transcript_15437/m.26518 type:complete len:389 (+) Transcript_15437:74-1240(+)